MRVAFQLITGTCESNANMDGWIITSAVAIAEGAEYLPLQLGDTIDIRGNVRRDGCHIGQI